MSEKNMKKAGSAWNKLDKNQRPYISGQIEVAGKIYYISLFTNGFKERDTQPDYNINISPKTE